MAQQCHRWRRGTRLKVNRQSPTPPDYAVFRKNQTFRSHEYDRRWDDYDRLDQEGRLGLGACDWLKPDWVREYCIQPWKRRVWLGLPPPSRNGYRFEMTKNAWCFSAYEQETRAPFPESKCRSPALYWSPTETDTAIVSSEPSSYPKHSCHKHK